jgi:hypothetical protein
MADEPPNLNPMPSDGQRLIAIRGQEGKSGSEYRTEIDTFSRVKFTGNYWTVDTKSGQTFEYGNTGLNLIATISSY